MSRSPNHSEHHYYASHFPANDPYRVMRKSATPDSSESKGGGVEHSRTTSESSTGRLANTIPYDPYDDYEDPYATRQKMRRTENITSARANSYLPYSHYRQDSFTTRGPMALEDDRLQSFATSQGAGSKGMGSLLQDNMIMDKMMEPANATADATNANRHKAHSTASMLESLPEELKRRRKKRRWCCGIRPRTALLISLLFIAIIVVIWYFVWPRWVSSVQFSDASLTTPSGESNTTYDATWELNLTVSNNDNWVPTRVKNFYVEVLDGNTNVKVGQGSTGSMVLPPKTDELTLTLPVHVYYSSNNPDDVTLTDLAACISINQESGTHQTINLIFQVEQQISGIAWKHTTEINPSMVTCPQW
ncbi:hypothetical protein RO3G_09512 [Lichtheimia corymbifera JMRC:FSU:9682]|uniref:Late embryogenesis abundant protein LEA-2 subgroup domain-containing protein n=1 Tax=Lichtheimia corymbifera JMRC:FSU:9682 TaxID=1263082 RepID=A0A068S7P0_9FUNG|nr:hypothetical protein RO3G_09512 [Lichtheimia corymbifera JMRC:FSU:9682]